MARGAGGAGLPATDPIYVAVAAAALLALVEGPRTAPVLTGILLSLLPWGLVAAGRHLSPGAFAVLAIAPLVPVVLITDVGSALFLATAASSRVASRSGAHVLLAATTAAVVVLPFLPHLLGDGHWDPGAVYFAFGNVFGVLAGALLRRTARLAHELRVADARLGEAAVREERHRIARDVHDLVAHSLTVVVLHVGGARRVLRTDPAAAEGALADAERVCRESLDGIRGVVGLLRDDDAEPRVLSLGLDLLADSYRAGLPVTLTVRGDPETLPLVVRVTLHRVVQEALATPPGTPGPALRWRPRWSSKAPTCSPASPTRGRRRRRRPRVPAQAGTAWWGCANGWPPSAVSSPAARTTASGSSPAGWRAGHERLPERRGADRPGR